FRPFPAQEIAAVLQNASKIAVIDRNISYGRSGILALELKAAMYSAVKKPPIFGFIGGLAGLSIRVENIRHVFEYTYAHEEPEGEIVWLGISAWKE
ncbi:unnamed protein product, partial [marine sediment metagenome]